jgi:ADP-heptose:LPS heptosyltransferase
MPRGIAPGRFSLPILYQGMGELRRPFYVPKPIGIREFHAKRNRILVWHDKGGLGDVLMQRMLFEDFKAAMPDAEIVFACLPEYHDAVSDHPFISEVIDSRTVNPHDYIVHFNTCVSVADRYEHDKAPFCMDHRADIWAAYAGVDLKRHNMHFRLDPTLLRNGRRQVEACRQKDGPLVLFAPVSKMMAKTLLPHQMRAVVEALPDCNLIGLHNREIAELTALGVPGVYGASVKEWIHVVASADYVVSVDTATFHLAGGLGKPLTGIFTFADGKVYGKYFDFVLVQKHRDDGWDCGPCFKFGDCPKCKTLPKPCLTELSVGELQAGVRRMLERWPPEKEPQH